MDEAEEGEAWGGVEGGSAAVPLPDGQQNAHKSKKPPMGEELRAIKDASELFKSSSFKLQIDALLPNVRPKASRVPPLEKFLFELHSFLKDVPSVAPQHPLEAARKLQEKGVAVPYALPLPTEETNRKVAFEPPSEINLVGSWANKVSVKPKDGLKFGVDLAVEMPDALSQEDPFNGTFLEDCRDLTTRFDVVLRVDLSSAKPRNSSPHSTIDVGSPSNALLASISSILRQGLGDRSRAITLLHPSSLPRPISQAHPSSPDTIFIGIIHDPQHAFWLVDHGPAADEQDQSVLETFRALWGDKLELRRFKDGRIVESVVWEVTNADERAHVPAMIVRPLLKWHFGLGEDAVGAWQTSYDSLLRLPPSISKEYIGSGVATGFKGAITAFDNLVKQIKNLDEELPLSLLNVSPISESLRYTSVFSPVPLSSFLAQLLPPNARYLAPIEIVMEFEKSSRWPDDLKAVQTIKLAFFERIASALMNSVDGLKAKVVVGDGVHDSQLMDKAVLEVVTPEGWAFHARIWHDREVNLLDQVIGGKASLLPHIVSKTKEKKTPEHYEALEAKEVYVRRFIHAPRHHRAIATLSHHYTAFSGTVPSR